MVGPVRPHYTVTVVNIDQGWTYTATHRETPPTWEDLADTPVLIDDLDMSWSFADDGQVPGPLDPDVVSFKIYARSAAILPPIETGDTILVTLDRPAADDGLIPYMHFAGMATDPVATTGPGAKVVLAVTATGFDSDLTFDGAGLVGGSGSVEQYANALMTAYLNAGFAKNDPEVFTRTVRMLEGGQLKDVMVRLCAGSVVSDLSKYGVLRYGYDWTPDPAAWDYTDTAWPGAPHAPVTYYLQPCFLTVPDALELGEDPDNHRLVVLGPPDDLDRVTVISARLVEVPNDWRKDRSSLVTEVDLTGISTGGAEITATTLASTATIRRYGLIKRDVETYVSAASMATIGPAYLVPGPVRWSIPSLAVKVTAMDDAELDQLAPTFYPHRQPVDSVLGRIILLTDIDEDVAVDGTDTTLQLTGCNFHVSGGQLSITPQLRPMPQADFTTSLTFDELAAGPLGDTTFTDTGSGHFINPALDIDELAYSDN